MVFDAIRAQALLAQMAEVLRQTGHHAWVSTFERMIIGLNANPDAARTSILGLFAGMGSLNDLVLHRHAVALGAENDAFDLLRSELYEVCRR